MKLSSVSAYLHIRHPFYSSFSPILREHYWKEDGQSVTRKNEEVFYERLSSGHKRTLVLISRSCDSVNQHSQHSNIDVKETQESPHLAELL